MDYCSGQQVKLRIGSTSLTSADRVQSVPLLPVPFVNSSLTRVVLQTGINSERLPELLASSSDGPNSGGGEREEGREGEGEGGGEGEGMRPLRRERLRTLLQKLLVDASSSQEPKPLIIGARDFEPHQMKGTTAEWRELEEISAGGPRGTPRENFQPSVVVMDQKSDNSHVPHCVMNGEDAHSHFTVYMYMYRSYIYCTYVCISLH